MGCRWLLWDIEFIMNLEIIMRYRGLLWDVEAIIGCRGVLWDVEVIMGCRGYYGV